jgi:hypothetical protein
MLVFVMTYGVTNKESMKIKFLSVLLIFCCAETRASTSEPPTIGNFSLPTSQQPAPFYSFGQNIVNKGDAQYFLTPNGSKSKTSDYFELSSSFLYGLSDKASVLLTIPYLMNNTSGIAHSSGYSDLNVQGEYAFYNSSNSQFTTQATLLGGISFPTGSQHEIPPTGYDCPVYFVGGTYNSMFVNWLWFASTGLQQPSNTGEIHYKPQLFYQSGLGHILSSMSNHYIFLGLLELNGQTNGADKASRFTRFNSNQNTVYLTPSLWFSTKKLIFQVGVSLPVAQRLSNSQAKTDYYAAGIVGLTID